MRGATLPAALLCAALGLLLAFAPRRAVLPAVVALAVAAIAASLVPLPARWIEIAFAGCWISIIVLAAGVHLPRGIPAIVAVLAAINAGLWSGFVIAGEGALASLPRALPAVALLLPARWMVARGWPIPVKIVSSWLIAVALLAALLPTAATTPGYVPDHMD